MNRRKERFVETFVTVMFPVALLVACTTNGNDNMTTENALPQSTAYNVGLSTTTPEQFTNAFASNQNNGMDELSWAVDKSDKNQYVMVSPSLHLAIYTPDSIDVENGDSIQMVNLKESYDVVFPEKSVFHFESDNYNTSQQDLDHLKQHAEFLLSNPRFTLTISGHTDKTGTTEYNQKLSEQRAQFVANILLTYGAPKSQLIVDGYGETVPVSDINNLEENRRVELLYSQPMMLSVMQE